MQNQTKAALPPMINFGEIPSHLTSDSEVAQSVTEEKVGESRDEMTLKISKLSEIGANADRINELAQHLSLGQIEALRTNIPNIAYEKLVSIGICLTLDQIHAAGVEHLAQAGMSEEKIPILGRFTVDQIKSFERGQNKAGEFLANPALGVDKLLALGKLSLKALSNLDLNKVLETSIDNKEFQNLLKTANESV